MSDSAPKIVLSQVDYERLSALIASTKAEAVAQLEEEVGRAEVLPEGEMPSNVVKMHSVAKVLDLDTKAEHEYALVFPHEANMAAGKISVLAPLGVALIGLEEGEEYEWETPNHRKRHFRVLEVREGAERASA